MWLLAAKRRMRLNTDDCSNHQLKSPSSYTSTEAAAAATRSYSPSSTSEKSKAMILRRRQIIWQLQSLNKVKKTPLFCGWITMELKSCVESIKLIYHISDFRLNWISLEDTKQRGVNGNWKSGAWDFSDVGTGDFSCRDGRFLVWLNNVVSLNVFKHCNCIL